MNAGTRRSAGGRLIVGGWPPRYLRLSAAGASALDAALLGDPTPTAPGLVNRLLEYGMLDPIAQPSDADVTFVIPVRNGGTALAALVAALIPFGPVIVVDDNSSDRSPELARRAGATVVANEGPGGPGGARNTGWQLAQTEFIAFIDADCRVRGDWARPLAGLLDADDKLALVAPRVRGNSPLDMGDAAGLVGPGRRISFVPSAAVVARREALAKLGGFDGALRFGEDVDLAWRAVAAGWTVRYAPELEVQHPPRETLRARARQYFDYGTSAAVLERRHPGSTAPLRITQTVLPAALFGTSAPARRAIFRLVLESHLASGEHLARAISRDWLPLSVLAAAWSRRARRFVLTAVAVDIATATARDPRGAPLNAGLRVVDNAAYCAGLWRGAIRQRSIQAILPRRQPS